MFRSLMRILSIALVFSSCSHGAPPVVSPDTPSSGPSEEVKVPTVVNSVPYNEKNVQPKTSKYYKSLDVKESLEVIGIASDFQIGCSAVMIGEGLALTAAHCVRSAPELVVRCDDIAILAFPSKIDAKSDLALLSLSMPCSRKLTKLAKEDPKQSSKIYGIGCPAVIGCEMVTAGVVGKYTFSEGATKKMVSDITLWHGNSGGPVLNGKGELVGIADAIRCLTQDSGMACYSYIVPISSIKEFLAAPQEQFHLEFK